MWAMIWSFPGGTSGRESACQCRRCKRHGFHPWVTKIPWRRKWQPTPAFLPGKPPWTEEPGELHSPWGRKESDMTKRLSTDRHQFSSVTQSYSTLWNPMDCSMPGVPVHHQLPEFTQTHVHWVSDAIQHLILCHPLLLLPPIPPSIRVFSNESNLRTRWPKYWSFNFSISPSNEHSGLNSFRMDWLDLLAVQGTFKSLLQHHSSKASILRRPAFFTVQLSHPYMTTGKTIALTRRTFVEK